MNQREILFRGKEILSGPWHEGFYLRDGARAWILSEGIMDLNATQIYPETLGQYTGLKDKNGVKIFEGDVISHIGERLGVVRYYKGILGFGFTDKLHSENESDAWFFFDCNPMVFEVIGNIHDNPNILNQKS